MGADCEAMLFRESKGSPHEIGRSGVQTAGDVDGGHMLEHPALHVHLLGRRAFAYVTVEIDVCQKSAHGFIESMNV
jgi:hypothetical protein